MTEAQRRALLAYARLYELPRIDGPLALEPCFGRRAPRWLEIGAGNGECVVSLAERHPENDYLAIEVYSPGAGSLLMDLKRRNIANVRLVQGDAVEVLGCLPARSFEGVMVYFPDPWPKTRHHKRRLLQEDFLKRIAEVMVAHGRLFIATDSLDYAEQALSAALVAGFCNLAPAVFAPRCEWRLPTRYERRARRFGSRVYDLMLCLS